MHHILRRYAVIALSALGSATLLFSCSDKPEATQFDYETLMTESSENRTITMMENGKRSYTFVTPLMEGYSMATNPYQEFRRGIKMTTYTQDSTNLVDATITANYAIYYENQRLWEAKGNVIIIKNNRKDGDTTVTSHTEIYTQQLFWNATTKKIYSNVDTKILQPDGWHFGVGFDADEDLKNIHFRKYSSEMEFDMSQPTAEELEQENKKREEEASKKSNNKDSNKRETNKGNTNKATSDRKFDPTKGNRPSSNTVKPSNSRPTTAPNNLKPSTNNALSTEATPSIKGQKTVESRLNTTNAKLNTTLQNSEFSVSSDMTVERSTAQPAKDRANSAVKPTSKK
ncbi:MAG: LPS export ABC transporter periplasmic protein LptC [Alistipes sp.]|nr:LPS export ABC transporter periplasmic protein LptC [Alistipes sp.]